MCANDKINFTLFYTLNIFLPYLCLTSPCEEQYFYLGLQEHGSQRTIVLFGKDFCRSHKGCLKTIGNGDKKCINSHGSLTGANVPLQKTIHWPHTAHIFMYLPDNFLLAVRKLEWKELVYMIFNICPYFEFVSIDLFYTTLTKCHRRLKQKELFILQPSSGFFQAV